MRKTIMGLILLIMLAPAAVRAAPWWRWCW